MFGGLTVEMVAQGHRLLNLLFGKLSVSSDRCRGSLVIVDTEKRMDSTNKENKWHKLFGCLCSVRTPAPERPLQNSGYLESI